MAFVKLQDMGHGRWHQVDGGGGGGKGETKLSPYTTAKEDEHVTKSAE